MATPTELTLLDLPTEILLLIFYETSTIQDACALARTCSQLHGLFSPFNDKINILRSAANVPRRPKCDSGKDLPGIITRKIHRFLLAKIGGSGHSNTTPQLGVSKQPKSQMRPADGSKLRSTIRGTDCFDDVESGNNTETPIREPYV